MKQTTVNRKALPLPAKKAYPTPDAKADAKAKPVNLTPEQATRIRRKAKAILGG